MWHGRRPSSVAHVSGGEAPLMAATAAARMFIDAVVRKLMSLNFTQSWKEDYMPTSEVHRLKMRGWQALVALAEGAACGSATAVSALVRDTSIVAMQNNHASIRYYVELFMSHLMLRQMRVRGNSSGQEGKIRDGMKGEEKMSRINEKTANLQ